MGTRMKAEPPPAAPAGLGYQYEGVVFVYLAVLYAHIV